MGNGAARRYRTTRPRDQSASAACVGTMGARSRRWKVAAATAAGALLHCVELVHGDDDEHPVGRHRDNDMDDGGGGRGPSTGLDDACIESNVL